jgi:hypothetical protein
MTEKAGPDIPVMNPSFGYTDGYILNRMIGNPYLDEKPGFAASDFIYVGTSGSFVRFHPVSSKSGATSVLGALLQYKAIGGEYTDWWNNKLDGSERTFALGQNKCYVRFGFDPDGMADMYAYNSATGQVYYAGKNTPYYGKTNIND